MPDKETVHRDPDTKPVHLLLSSFARALQSVTDVSQLPEIIYAMKSADAATRTRQQAPVWKAIAEQMNGVARVNGGS